ncbi:MAG: YihY/virulence factor BrkB family protein [Myxococcota bacterium]|nr:YihY/virulence factor BrkB family protein [Myxococcota bacterium]
MKAPSTRGGLRWNELWSLVKETATDWNDHNAARLAAALACYTLLSIAPLVVLSVAVAGLAFGDQAARGEISAQIGAVVGADAAHAVEAIVVNAKTPSSGIIGTVFGIVVLLFGASGVFGELESALNTIWGVAPKPGRGWKGLVMDRFFSFTMVIAVAFLLLVSLVMSAALAATGKFFSSSLPGGDALWQVVNFIVALGITTLLFGIVFKYVPAAKIDWRDVWLGAVVTAVLFGVGKLLLGLYIGRSSITSAYGAAGSLVALVIWVYYTSQIVFMGAEFTQVHARRSGRRVQPADNAVAVEPPSPAKPVAGPPRQA